MSTLLLTQVYRGLSIASQRRECSFNTLPMELLVEIARLVTIPRQVVTPSKDYPTVTQLNNVFGCINKRAREAFYEVVRQDFVFAEIHFYSFTSSVFDVSTTVMFQKIFGSDQAARIQHSCADYGFHCSHVLIKFWENKTTQATRTTRLAMFMNPWNYLLMMVVFQAQVRCFRNVEIDCSTTLNPVRKDVTAIIEGLSMFAHGMMSMVIKVPSRIMERAYFDRLIRPTSQIADDTSIQAAHSKMIKNICFVIQNGKHAFEILPIIADTAHPHIRRFSRMRVLKSPHEALILQRNFDVTLILKGIADYLLRNPNHHHSRTHYLLADDNSYGTDLIAACLRHTESILEIVRAWNCSVFNTASDTRVFATMLMACIYRAEYEVATTRTATLAGFAINEHVRRAPRSPFPFRSCDELNSTIHLATARQYARILTRVRRVLRTRSVTLPHIQSHLLTWIDEFNAYVDFVERAIDQRPPRSQVNILVEPVCGWDSRVFLRLCLKLWPRPVIDGSYVWERM